MEADKLQTRVESWVDRQISFGRNAFSLEMLEKELPAQSDIAVKRSLNRLSRKRKIASVHKGYYVIVTPQYWSLGVLPPALFIDGLMKYLGRQYYVGLLNAAAFYGAAHQAPQEFFVVTGFPAMRPARKKGIKINYLSKKRIPEHLLTERKTETGTVKVSSAELTAADIVQYQRRVGGLNRAAEVLAELTESMSAENLNASFIEAIPTAVTQRLGFLLEQSVGATALADRLYESARSSDVRFFPVPLNAAGMKRGFPIESRWEVIINEEIETDW